MRIAERNVERLGKKIDLLKARLNYHNNNRQPSHEEASNSFSRNFIINLAKLLSLQEIEVVISAEKVRETGLGLARNGNIEGAKDALNKSRRLLEDTNLPSSALRAGYTFQSAAEAYVAYLQKDLVQAKSLLLYAVSDCCFLMEKYGFEMEFRKIHLIRNILRLKELSKRNKKEFILRNLDLIRYASGTTNYYSLDGVDYGTMNRRLNKDELVCVTDEILTNFRLELITSTTAHQVRQYWNSTAHLCEPLSKEISAWLETIEAISLYDRDKISLKSISFLEVNKSQLVYTEKFTLEKALELVCDAPLAL